MRLQANRRKKREDVEEADSLEKDLLEIGQKLNKMLLCSKIPKCVLQYQSSFRLGGKDFKANLIQILSFTIQQIKEITD